MRMSFSKDVRDEAIAFTRESLVIDMYTTSFQYGSLMISDESLQPGWFAKKSDRTFDLPKVIEGGLDIFGISMLDGYGLSHSSRFFRSNESENVTWLEEYPSGWEDFAWPPEPFGRYRMQTWRSYLTYGLIFYDVVMREIEALPERLILVRKSSDIIRAKHEGKVGIILDCNCVQMIEDSLEMLRVLYRLGYRDMLLARFSRNLVVDSWVQSRADSGLTPFGVTVIREMNRLGMIVDLSHTSDRCFYDVLEVAKDPVICSHSNARAVFNHPRNLSDDQIHALAEKRGVIGLMTFFIGPGPEYRDRRGWKVDDPRFQKWLDHCDHIVNLVGVDYVGWGSDGYETMIHSPVELPKITEGLMRRGYSKKEIKKILGENFLRIFKEVVG